MAKSSIQYVPFFFFFCWLPQGLVVWSRLDDLFYYFYYYFIPSEFFALPLAGDLSPESERQQVSSGLQDFSQYFDRSQLYFCLVGLSSYEFFIATLTDTFSLKSNSFLGLFKYLSEF